ncbi:MAG: hypothetical protein QOI95_3129 [Acidimicrobiaceae bacterium]|jgi:hypothetical protein
MTSGIAGRSRPLAARRAAWTIVDQFLSAATNLGVGVVVARHTSADEYGVFGVAFAAYAVALGISRALATDPLVVRYSTTAGVDRRPVRAALGTALVIGGALGALGAIAGLLVGGHLATTLVITGLVLPGLLLQDALRYAAFAEGRPSMAARNDALWLLLLVVAFVGPARDVSTAAACLVGWGLSGAVAGLSTIAMMRIGPSLVVAAAWLRDHRDLGPRFAIEFVLTSGGFQLVLFATASIAGYADAGALRGSSVLLGPVTVLSAGAMAAAVPELVRARQRSSANVRTAVMLLAGGLAVVTAAWGVVARLLPDRVGEALLGDTWPAARSIMIPLGIAAAGNAAATGFAIGLRSLAAARRSLAAAAPAVVLVIVGGVTGAVIDGSRGAAIGMIAPTWIGAALFGRQFRLAVRSI